MRKKINATVVHGEAWASAVEKVVQYWPVFAGFVGMTGLGTFFASGVTELAAHGWGAVAIAGLGIACFVSLIVSIGLVAWRYFKPLPRRSDDEAAADRLEGEFEFGNMEWKFVTLDPGEDLGGSQQYFQLWCPIRFKRKVSSVTIRISVLRPLQPMDRLPPQYVWKPVEDQTFFEGDTKDIIFATVARNRQHNGYYGEMRPDTCYIAAMSRHLFEIDVLIGTTRTTKRIYLESLPSEVYGLLSRDISQFGNLFFVLEESDNVFQREWVRTSRDAVAGRITLPLSDGSDRRRGGLGAGWGWG